MKTLVFKNYFHVDEGESKEPMICELLLDDRCDYAPILEMYGSHWAGDRYHAFLNGEQLRLDINGDLESDVIDITANLKCLN